MRVLLLNYEFPPLGGGAANATYYLLKEFSGNPDVEISLITSSVDTEKTEQFADNITIHYLNIGKEGNIHYQSQKDLLRYSLQAYKKAKTLHEENPFDLTHAFFGIPSGVIAKKLGIPYIVSLRGSDVPFYNQRFYWHDKLLFQRLSTKVWKHAEQVVANSTQLADLAHKTLPESQLHIPVIPNGVDTRIFSPVTPEPPTTPFRVLCVSRLIKRKGIHLLIDAVAEIAKHHDIQLDLAGSGNMEAELTAQAEKLGIGERVHFHGAIDHKKLPGLYRSAHLFVLPSSNEGMSNTALEALASGLPLVLTDTGGAQELVDGNGALVPVGDVQALTQAISTIMKNATERQQYREHSRTKAEAFSWYNTAQQYLELYQQI